MTFAEQLNEIMKKENLTQKEVSVICHIHKTTVSKYVNGDRTPSYETACQIVKDLGYELGIVEKKRGDKKRQMRRNGSGYSDPTAYRAMKNADKDRERMMKLLDLIFTIADLAGFHVEERIVLRDKKTGKVWR